MFLKKIYQKSIKKSIKNASGGLTNNFSLVRYPFPTRVNFTENYLLQNCAGTIVIFKKKIGRKIEKISLLLLLSHMEASGPIGSHPNPLEPVKTKGSHLDPYIAMEPEGTKCNKKRHTDQWEPTKLIESLNGPIGGHPSHRVSSGPISNHRIKFCQETRVCC